MNAELMRDRPEAVIDVDGDLATSVLKVRYMY